MSHLKFALYLAALAVSLAAPVARAEAPISDLRQISMSDPAPYHACAVTSGGALRCAGNNTHGEVGNGDPASYVKLPVEVIASGVSAVATGDSNTCAIVNGALLCWGANEAGQAGIGGSGNDITRPKQMIASGVTAVSIGAAHACAIVNGALLCWGSNRYGEVGTGNTRGPVAAPTQVFPAGVTAVAAGKQHTCAVIEGALKCWGFLMLKGSFDPALAPVTMIPSGVTAVSAALHTCAIVNGALHCFGRNFHGEAGTGSASVPVEKVVEVIPGGVTAVDAGTENTCAIVREALYCWGWNLRGQLGTGAISGRVETPQKVIDGGVTAVAVTDGRICAVAGGTLRCTGAAIADDAAAATHFIAEGTPFSIPDPEPPRIAQYGVWRGTVGKQEVMVLLAPAMCEANYYYLRHLLSIGLTEQDKRGQTWAESTQDKPLWKFETSTATTLAGQWTTADGKRSVPIRLKLVRASHATVESCGELHAEFDAPRLAATKETVTEGRFGTHRIRTISALNGAVQGIEVPEGEYTLPNLNKAMREWRQGQIHEYYWCSMAPNGFDFNQEIAPAFWSGPLLVLKETYSSYCGGAHPNGGVARYVTWDLTTDKEINPWTWIRTSKTKFGFELPEKLKALILASAGSDPGDEECLGYLRDISPGYLVHPEQNGLVFTTTLPHVVQACDRDIEIPYPKLRPYLTPEGIKAVEALTGKQGGR